MHSPAVELTIHEGCSILFTLDVVHQDGASLLQTKEGVRQHFGGPEFEPELLAHNVGFLHAKQVIADCAPPTRHYHMQRLRIKGVETDNTIGAKSTNHE